MYRYIHKVQYYETDKMQITHHSNYIRFMEEARIGFLDACGYSYAHFEEEGVISPVVSVSCDFKKKTTFSDVIEIEVRVGLVKPARFVLVYTMYVKGEVVCTADSEHCFVRKDGSIVNIKKEYPEFFAILNSESEE